jgi:hypothetical protein
MLPPPNPGAFTGLACPTLKVSSPRDGCVSVATTVQTTA